MNPLVRQFELARWLFAPGQNSQVAVTLFYREVHYFRVARNSLRPRSQSDVSQPIG